MCKQFIKIGCITILFFLFLNNALAQEKTQKPNILFIVADDLGYEKLGSYSGLQSLTPNLDKLAEQSSMFLSAYASPVCTPSRMSIYTGTYAATHRYTEVLPVHVGTKEYVDFNNWTTYAQLLKQNDYHTAVTGKWQMAALEYYPKHCSSAGFDSWCVWQIWHNNKKTKRYWNATINEDGKIRTDIDSLFGPDVLADYVIRQMKLAKQKGRPFIIQHNMALPHVPIIKTPDDKNAKREPSLDNMINYMDKQVGVLLEAVDQLNLRDNTIVIFVGDNGTQSELPREIKKGLVHGGKWSLTDGGMHVPLVIRCPDRIPQNQKIQNLIDITDLFPTICDLTNTKIDERLNIDGISFKNLLLGEESTVKREWITAGIDDDYIIFDGNWRLHHQENKLIDCRNLPEEKNVDLESDAAKEALAKLTPILNELLIDKS